MIVIPEQPANEGDVIEHEGHKYTVGQHYSQGAEIKNTPATHIMFDNKGAFVMVPVVK